MRLSLHADLGLRTLIYLAAAGEAGGTISTIAASHGISENHLRKVVHHLVRNGLVESQRGRNGGIRLAMAPRDIGVGAVMRLMEPDFALVDCMGHEKERCILTGNCGLQTILVEALKAWLAVLDRYTLADVIAQSRNLGRILGLANAVPRAVLPQAGE